MNIFNDAQLQLILEQKAINVLEKSSKEILEDFKEYVNKYVYNNHKQNVEYEDTWEFREAWKFSNVEKKANQLVTEMFNDPSKMSFNPNSYSIVGTHGSTFGDPNDVRDDLPMILDKHLSSSLFVSVYRSETYWDKFTKEYVDGGKLRAVLNKYCLDEGLFPSGFSGSVS